MKASTQSWLLMAVVFVSAGVLGFLTSVSVASVEGISYPVAELGSCANETECRSFCDKPENSDLCMGFAEKNNLTSGDSERAKQLAELDGKPGNCGTAAECESYCNDVSHLDECLAFAEKNNFMPPEDLEEARKLQAALANGAKLPGSCNTKEACDSYCNDPNNIEECITFGEAAGLIPADELEDARKVMQAIKKGVKPPPCGGKTGCDAYCSKPENIEQCITFAEAAGMIPASELEEAKKMMQAIKKGAKLPNCRGKAECDVYCADLSHMEECVTFAAAAGFMTEEEAARVKKMGGVGPGGCRSRESCESFCNNPDNRETCFNFQVERGMLPQEELERIESDKRRMQETLANSPPEVEACLVNTLGQEMVEKMKAGTAMGSERTGNAMRECSDSYWSQYNERNQRERQEQGEEGMDRGEWQQGDGGQYQGGEGGQYPSGGGESSGEGGAEGIGQTEGQPSGELTTGESGQGSSEQGTSERGTTGEGTSQESGSGQASGSTSEPSPQPAAEPAPQPSPEPAPAPESAPTPEPTPAQ